MPGLEREFKLRLPDEEHLRALEARLAGWPAARARQVNHFFDTAGRALRSARLALRLREEAGRFALTLKGPAQPGPEALATRAEEEQEVTAAEARAILAGERSPLAPLARSPSALVAEARALSAREPLRLLGAFENERLRLGPRPFPPGSAGPALVLELDRTRYPDGSLERELELELPEGADAAGIERELRALLASLGIPFETGPSKAARFFGVLDAARAGTRPPAMLLFPLTLAPLLLPRQAEPGFTALFDGQTLAGWTERGGRYDGDADWRVEEGCIVGRQGPNGEGGLLYTERSYTSLELRLEVKLDHPFDSGVFLRMVPPSRGQKGLQVTLDWREGGEIGALYADGFLQHNEEGAQRFRRDDWNDLRVRCTGFDAHVQVWLNGQVLTDFRAAPAIPFEFAPAGRIGLQVHGERGDTGAARFRNLRLQELPLFADDFWSWSDVPPGEALTPGAAGRGWRALFDGRSLEGWSIAGPEDRFRVRDGVLEFLARGGGGHLASAEDFQDFELRLDFRLASMANSGLFLRAARDGSNPAFSGCELQILDDFDWERVTGTTLKPWQFTGSLYGAVPNPERGALRPIGTWNTYEVLYRGARLAVALNGRTLYDVDTRALVPEQGEPFAQRAPGGFLGLQHHGAEVARDEPMVSFRNLYVRRL